MVPIGRAASNRVFATVSLCITAGPPSPSAACALAPRKTYKLSRSPRPEEDTNPLSFPHLFSFGGAADALVPREPVEVELAWPATNPVRPRSPTAHQDVTKELERRHYNLSDPEDLPDEVLTKAAKFCRGGKDIDKLRHEWFGKDGKTDCGPDLKANRR